MLCLKCKLLTFLNKPQPLPVCLLTGSVLSRHADSKRSVSSEKPRNAEMRQLTTEDLKTLEKDLKNYFPQSLQVYGCIVQVIRNGQRADPVTVLVDYWPEFKVLLIKPELHEKGDVFKDVTVFSKNEDYLKVLLAQTNVIDWKEYICLGTCIYAFACLSHQDTLRKVKEGFGTKRELWPLDESLELQDESFESRCANKLRHEKMLEVVAVKRGVPVKKEAVCRMLVLRDPSSLPAFDSLSLKLSSLNESHLELVNRSWKFGCEESKVMIKNMIGNFPSCCVLDSDDQPVAWILTYVSCALGMLYTLPEHRGKGYAKALVNVMSKRLHSQGYPVYCFVEEENQLSYSLFTSLGFTEEPNFRAAWFGFNNL